MAQKVRLEVMLALMGSLTPRERQVFDLVVRGRINKQIARELGAERTIKAHRSRVMEKMQVNSVAELVSLAEGSVFWATPTADRRSEILNRLRAVIVPWINRQIAMRGIPRTLGC